MGEDLAGGDIHGLRPRKDSFNDGEVPVAKLDEDDFGIELPASDIKVAAFDEVDKEECFATEVVMTAFTMPIVTDCSFQDTLSLLRCYPIHIYHNLTHPLEKLYLPTSP